MNQSINTDSKNIKEPQQKYRLGTVSIKILGEERLTVSINTVKRSDVIHVTPKIEGKHLPMELDTGSAISVIPIKIHKELFSNKPLSVTNTKLKTYSGQTITPAGIINVHVNYEGQEHNLD